VRASFARSYRPYALQGQQDLKKPTKFQFTNSSSLRSKHWIFHGSTQAVLDVGIQHKEVGKDLGQRGFAGDQRLKNSVLEFQASKRDIRMNAENSSRKPDASVNWRPLPIPG
jgi:hypothetical protein